MKIIHSLEKKVNTLLDERMIEKQNYAKILEELNASDHYSKQLENELVKWQENYDALKVVDTMLKGSNYNKTDAKRKLNSLIKELDNCIVQLSK